MRINVFKSGGNSAQGGFVSNGLTLQGPLILSGPHTEPLHAVPKQYVDNAAYNLDANNITSGTLAAARLPAFTGDGSTILGSSNIILAATGVTPGSIVKPTVDAKGRVISSGSIIESDISGIGFNKFTVGLPDTLDEYGITDAVRVSGTVALTGQLIQSADPVNPDHAATKQYVDSAAGIAGGISIGDIIRKPYSTTPTGFLKCNGGEVDKTTYANLYSVIGDTFASNLTPGCGKPWQLQYAFNKSQTSDVLGWNIGTPLPSVLCHTTAVVTKNRVYCLGGYNGSAYTSTVYTAPINADGTIGTWAAGTSLPLGLIASSGFAISNKIYLVGGATGTGTYLSNVYYATINSDGSIGAWVSAPSLPGVLGYTKVIVTKKRVYTLAGNNGSIAISTIYTAAINDDGTLGSWSAHGSLPYSGYLCYTAVIKDRLYVIGGYSSGYRRDVYYANIDNDGVIGSWISGVFLPKGMSHGECFTTENKIHITFTNEVYTAPIYSDGSLGTWYKSATLPYDMGETECVVTNSKIYLISAATASYNAYVIYADFKGGSNDYSSYYGESTVTDSIISGSGKPWQQQYQINTTQSTDIIGWSTSSSTLPIGLGLSNAIVTKNRVYLLGGHNGTSVLSSVYTAPINADGTLGTWSSGTALPGPVCYSQAVVTKNRVYILGGSTTGANMVATVYTAPINADGTLGAWGTDISLPTAFAYSQAVVTKNKLHLIGGNNGSSHTGIVYTAAINADGTLGAWGTGNSLPGPLVGAQAIVTKNRIYVCSGSNGAYTTTVYTAVVNSDGSIGTWSAVTSLPGILGWSQSFVTKDRAYLLGGSTTGNNAVSTVYTAPINADGTLGTWAVGTSLSGINYYTQAIATKNRIYLLGGHNGSAVLSTIYTASINSDINDYSPYYDGTNSFIDTSINYTTPGSGQPWQQQYQINTTQTGNITGWTAGTALPLGLGFSSTIVTKNRVYVIGGYANSGMATNVYSAVINADGSLAAWVSETNFPVAIGASQTIVYKNRVYVFGGWNSANAVSSIYTAPINADGTLGAWSLNASTLPIGLTAAGVALIRNKIYIVGGFSSSGAYVSNTYFATINSDGSISSWSTGTTLPWVVGNNQLVITKNRAYSINGFDGTNSYNQIATAVINSDGTIGLWSISPVALPGGISHSQIFTTKNYLYILGGWSSGASFSTIFKAPISIDGTIGNWVSSSNLPYVANGHSIIVVKNRIYIIGGRADGTQAWYSGVSYATISSDIQDYSPYYDGTIQPVSTVSTKFKLPDYTLLDREFGEYVSSYIKY